MNDVEGEKVEIIEEERFEVKQAPLIRTRALGHHEQSPWNKKLDTSGIVEQAVHGSRKWTFFSSTIDDVLYRVSREVHTTHHGWTYLMPDNTSLPQVELVCPRKRESNLVSGC